MDDLEEQLASTRIEDEDGSIDGFGGQVAFEGFMDGDSVDIGVIYEPDSLITEQFSIIEGIQVWFSRFRRIQL